jgi:transcriptional regulator with XRE-family HTH domain
MEKFHYGKNLRKIRESKGISQEAMGYQLNISQKTYSRKEHKAAIPGTEEVNATAKALGADPSELLPPLEEPNLHLVQAQGSGMSYKAKEIPTPFNTLTIIAIGCALMPSAYAFTQAMCIEFGASDDVVIIAPRLAAAAVFAYLWYWVWKIKRKK